jgi:hypothetical protein
MGPRALELEELRETQEVSENLETLKRVYPEVNQPRLALQPSSEELLEALEAPGPLLVRFGGTRVRHWPHTALRRATPLT